MGEAKLQIVIEQNAYAYKLTIFRIADLTIPDEKIFSTPDETLSVKCIYGPESPNNKNLFYSYVKLSHNIHILT